MQSELMTPKIFMKVGMYFDPQHQQHPEVGIVFSEYNIYQRSARNHMIRIDQIASMVMKSLKTTEGAPGQPPYVEIAHKFLSQSS